MSIIWKTSFAFFTLKTTSYDILCFILNCSPWQDKNFDILYLMSYGGVLRRFLVFLESMCPKNITFLDFKPP